MIFSKFFNRKTYIIAAGVVLTGYLILILTVINLGQNKLKESQQNELRLKVAHYAYTLGYFFKVSQDNLQVLSEDKTMTTFFHNRNSGMSFAYGLGASLFKLEELIKGDYLQNKMNNEPILNRVSLLNLDGSLILDSTEKPLNLGFLNIQKLIKNGQLIHIEQLEDSISIRLAQVIYLNGDPIAFITAEISNEVIIQQLTTQEHLGSGSHLELTSPMGNLFIWDSLMPSNKVMYRHAAEFNQLLFLEKPIQNTPLTLIGWYEPVNNQDLFTSHWFIGVISMLAVPVILGLYFLMRVERNNTVLQTEVSSSLQQQQQLAQYNYQLETEINKRKSSEKELKHQAAHDALTGLLNRNYSLKRLAHMIDVSKRNNTKVLLMYIDLDNFKQINDTLGHSAGDEVLVEASKRLVASLRKTDTVSRLGGDEFLVILPGLEDNQHATILANKVLDLFERPFEILGHESFISTSLGLSIYPQDGDTPDTLLKCADMALYRVKDEGRNSFSFYDPEMNAKVLRNDDVSRRLRHAIEYNKLEMYYQPLVDLHTGKILGAEALMRWTDEELGFVSPEEFIGLAERNGLIHQLGEFALTQACQQAAQWQEISPLQIAVNFSSVQFRDSRSLFSKIINTLEQTGLPASKLDIEVTESLLINQEEELSKVLFELNQLGIQLSLDDFGTGYSALSYLQKYAFNKLKIDRAFVTHLSENSADRSLVTAIIAMAKALNLKVVSEGIEDQAQADLLATLNCDLGQGYLFSKPLPASDFEKLLLADNR